VFKKNRFLASFLTITVLSFALSAGQVVIGGWTIITNTSGAVASMILSNPKTQLNIESTIEIFVDYQGNPVRGHVKFRNGFERDMNYPQEVITYWVDYGGPNATWKYFASVNKVDLYNPDEAVISSQMYGRPSRVIDKSGKEYFGKVVEFGTNPDWFIILTKNSSVPIYRHAVAVMQQLK
jgi:hypothetical protein